MPVALAVALAAVVLVPLGREYADLRRSCGLGRLAALGTTLFVLPSLGVGVALALPLAGRPPLQWATTVGVALLVYSAAAAAIRTSASAAHTSK